MVEVLSPEQVVRALGRLRAALEARGLQTESSAGRNPYFHAFTRRDPRTGIRGDGLFLMAHGGTDFTWSRDSRWPMTDIFGAVEEITAVIARQNSDNPDR